MSSYMLQITMLDGKRYYSESSEFSESELEEVVDSFRVLLNDAKTVNLDGLYHNGDKVASLIFPVSQVARIEVL